MMQSFMNWIDMGGYAFYVWSAYGLVMTVFVGNMLSIKRQHVNTRKKLENWFRSNEHS